MVVLMETVKILMNRYELGKLLGQGNFAKVYYARNINTNQIVAIKVFDKDKVLSKGLDLQTKREISAMGKLRHCNILQAYEVLASRSKIYLVLEYAKGGELFNKVKQGRLKEDVVRWVFQQLISAVDFCHSRGVYHRDLKLENLLLDESGNLKVSDFGLSTFFEHKRDSVNGRLLRTVCGTPTYVAPEVITRKGYDGAKADIWSCGVILYAMLAGHLPFRDSNLNELYKKMRKAQYKCPSWFPSEVHKLLAKILDPNPKTRITSAKIMENPWFRRGLGTKPSSVIGCTNPEDDVTIVQQPRRQREMNAFDIISLASGFDLSGLFVDDDQKEDVRFLSKAEKTSDIMLALQEAAIGLGMRFAEEDGGLVRMSRGAEGAADSVKLDVQVLEFTTSFHLVEVKRSGGALFEYRKVVMEEMKPALKDIVWAWQGNQIYQPLQV